MHVIIIEPVKTNNRIAWSWMLYFSKLLKNLVLIFFMVIFVNISLLYEGVSIKFDKTIQSNDRLKSDLIFKINWK
jgi:hypothetical protein